MISNELTTDLIRLGRKLSKIRYFVIQVNWNSFEESFLNTVCFSFAQHKHLSAHKGNIMVNKLKTPKVNM